MQHSPVLLMPNSLRRYLHKVLLPMRDRRRYKHLYLKHDWERIEDNSILLLTIPKSGTTYFRLILANYLNQLFNADNTVITHSMLSAWFPNVRDYILFGAAQYLQPNDIILNTSYIDFIHGHHLKFLELCNARIVTIHRNPLDTIVSSFFHRYKNRPSREHIFNEVSDSIDAILDGDKYYQGWIERYLLIRKLALKKDNVLRISYEMLWREPISTFSIVLYYLRLPVDTDALHRAVDYANIKRVHDEETKSGTIHPVDGFKGYFTRSGKIGQWKEHLSSDDVMYIADKLRKSNIDISEFVIE